MDIIYKRTLLGKVLEPTYQENTLANGLLVATFPQPWLHEVGVMLLVRAGSRFESEEQCGVAHFLEHMLFKGTQRIPDPTQLHAHLEAMAADMNAATGLETNAYWITLPPEYLEEGLSIFAEIFTQPAFSDIETERRVILAEMREDENDREEIIQVAQLAATKLWPGHPLARPVLGNRETVARMDETMMRAYLQHHYCGVNMGVAFFGPIDHAQSMRLAQSFLGTLPSGEPVTSTSPPPMPPGPHWVAVADQTSQFSLSLFFRTGGLKQKGGEAVSAIRRILDDGFSSRLQATVREQQGLVYDVWSSYALHSDTGALELGASVSPENLEALFLALIEQIVLLRNEPPDDAEWQRVLTRWHAAFLTSLDRPLEMVERYVADRLCQVMEPITVTWQRIQTLDPATFPQIVRSITPIENLVVVLVGPQAPDILPTLQQLFEEISPTLWDNSIQYLKCPPEPC
ncbi:MAG: insulinase family protein [Magnetococcus sp. DMHC-6]